MAWRPRHYASTMEFDVEVLVPESNLFYANRIGRLYLQSMAHVVGQEGLTALLAETELTHFDQQLPPDDLQRGFDFANFANLDRALVAAYGPRGARRLALETGREVFRRGLQEFGPLVGATDFVFRALPLATKIRIGLPLLARIFTQFTDQITRVESSADFHLYYIDACPVCWGRTSDEPICFLAQGVLEESLHWVSGGKSFPIEQIECRAGGADSCVFKVTPVPIEATETLDG